MNEQFIETLLSKKGIALIQQLPTNASKAISIDQLAKKIGISSSSTYRIMQGLVKWPNIISFDVTSEHRPLTLYYIKSNHFAVNFTNKRVEIKA